MEAPTALIQCRLFTIYKSALLFTSGGASERIWSEFQMNKCFFCPQSGNEKWKHLPPPQQSFQSQYFPLIIKSKKRKKKDSWWSTDYIQIGILYKKDIYTVFWMAVRIQYRHELLHSSWDISPDHHIPHHPISFNTPTVSFNVHPFPQKPFIRSLLVCGHLC